MKRETKNLNGEMVDGQQKSVGNKTEKRIKRWKPSATGYSGLQMMKCNFR